MQEGQFTTAGFVRSQIDGLLSWWENAGVDCAVDEAAYDWLNPPPPRQPLSQAPVSATISAPAANMTPPWPTESEAFRAYLGEAKDLPENRWPGRRLLPAGPMTAPRLMIILPGPDSNTTEDMLLGEQSMRLLVNMLRCVGLHPDECHIASLSILSPPGGMLDTDIIAPLLRRMRHHIGLVAPQALLLVGDQTNRAFAPTSDSDKAGHLPFVNHSEGMVPCASILHPRLILEQPSAKAGAWDSLLRLFGGQKH